MSQKQTMVLDAGGMVLNAVSGSDVRIPPAELSFSIYAGDAKEDGDRGLVMSDVKPNTLVGLSTGTYHIVSEYGAVNAVIRADIQVEAGKVTEATIQHRAAKITFKLVSDAGGEAIADTAWSILTSAGDIVGESLSAFPVMVLAEGQYTAVARNKDKIYQRDFTVVAGRNTDVEVLMKEQQPQDADDQQPAQQIPSSRRRHSRTRGRRASQACQASSVRCRPTSNWRRPPAAMMAAIVWIDGEAAFASAGFSVAPALAAPWKTPRRRV